MRRLLPFLALCGCAGPIHGQGGFVQSLEDDDTRAVGVELRGGGWHHQRAEVGWHGGFALRGKVGADLAQGALAQEVVVVPFPHLVRFSPFVRGGFNLIQVERLADDWAFGMLSPFYEAGLSFAVERSSVARTFVTVSAVVEYDVRFTGGSSEPFAGILVGVGRAKHDQP